VNALFAAASAPAVIAHQGGWDEALLIGTPILAIIGLLWLAKRRVDAAHETTHAGHDDATGGDATDADVTEPDHRHV
jgi:hypothetical protein